MGLISDILGGGGSGPVAPAYTPFSTATEAGSVNVEDGNITTTLAPQYRDIVNMLVGAFGGVQPSLSPEALALGRGATGAGAGFLSGLSSFDPTTAAKEQFDIMESILEPGRQRSREELEAKLLRQGRLGSTGGGIESESLETAIEQSRRAGLLDAMRQSQAVQKQQAELATSLGAFGGTVEDTQLQRLLQSLGTATALEALPIELGQLGALYSGQKSAHDINAANINAQNQQGAFGDLLGGLLTGAGTAFAGPAGTAFANWAFNKN